MECFGSNTISLTQGILFVVSHELASRFDQVSEYIRQNGGMRRIGAYKIVEEFHHLLKPESFWCHNSRHKLPAPKILGNTSLTCPGEYTNIDRHGYQFYHYMFRSYKSGNARVKYYHRQRIIQQLLK